MNSRAQTSPEAFLLRRDLLLGEIVGSGGYGTVYRARHLALEVDRAVKLYAPSAFSDDLNSIRRFGREAAALAALAHPGIVRLFDAGFAGSQAFIVTEFAAGSNLQTMLVQKSMLPVAEVLAILHQAVAAIGHAHDKGVVHRDLKPSNLIWDGSSVKVVDFGAGAIIEKLATSRITTGPVGTSGFIAPELLETPTLLSPSSDVYSLGVTAYVLLTGHLPYPSGLDRELRDRGVEQSLRSALIGAVGPPSDRFRSCRDFLAALPPITDDDTTA